LVKCLTDYDVGASSLVLLCISLMAVLFLSMHFIVQLIC